MQLLLLLWKLQSINFKAEKMHHLFFKTNRVTLLRAYHIISCLLPSKKYSKISGLKPYTNALPGLYLTTQHQSQNIN